jgi:hypothetical protein
MLFEMRPTRPDGQLCQQVPQCCLWILALSRINNPAACCNAAIGGSPHGALKRLAMLT